MEPRVRNEPIAVVGIGLRFPGGNDTLDGFRDFLRRGGSGIVPLPADRFAADWLTPPPGSQDEPGGRIGTAGGGFLEGIDEFDAGFFNISPREAKYLDPQQRILLETAWAALEHAGIDPTALRHGDGGVYIGASSIDYALEMEGLPYEDLDPALATGFTIYPMSGRLSYFLGWRGPSLSTDTACSSSLTALHLAVGGLRRGECGIALVGAVNLIHHPRTLALFSQGGMLAADGHCKTFDEAADGYARAEGCGVLVLKRLSDAERDGDTVLALVRGTAIGQDGESAGLTVPNGTAQEQITRVALADAGLEPGDVQYVEAHGTGTPLGDPIEAGSINAVFGASRKDGEPLRVGSLKSNIGHMEPAAGLGGIVKIILQMREREFFPHLYRNPSGRIPWDAYPFDIPTELTAWSAPTRRAVVNSFGFAGSIGVAVLEQAPERAAAEPPREPERGHVLAVSAKSARALRGRIERYSRHLIEHPETDIADLCYTAAVGRAHFPVRAAGVARDRGELIALLDSMRGHAAAAGAPPKRLRKVAFLFAGTGGQHVGMGASLYRRFPVYRERLDACDRLFAPHLGLSIRDLMHGTAGGTADIHELRYAQPALFSLEYALAGLWMSWGIRPSVVVGHSLGEIAAAAVAGLFDLEDAVRFVAVRAALMASTRTPGAMAAVALAADELRPLVQGRGDVVLAAVNSPQQCVISGETRSVLRLMDELAARGVRATRLAVPVASHSPLMAQLEQPLREVLAGVVFHEPRLSLVSNLTGRVAGPGELATPDYWVRHLLGTVDFEGGMRAIEARGKHAFIEIGPGSNLTTPAVQCVTAADHAWLASLNPEDTEGVAVLRAAAEAYAVGLPLSWTEFYRGRGGRRIELPSYAFDRDRYWLPKPRLHSRAATLAGAPKFASAALDGAAETAEGTDVSASLPLDGGQPASVLPSGALGLVLTAVARVLQIRDPAAVDPAAKFVELGLNSLVSVEFRNALQDAAGVTLPASVVFDHPSPELLAAHLEDEIAAGRAR